MMLAHLMMLKDIFRHESFVQWWFKKGEYINMAKAKTLCNICGKEFDMLDEQEELGLHTRFGYGTKFDGDSIDLDICCDCFDKLMDKFIPMCKINPITEMD